MIRLTIVVSFLLTLVVGGHSYNDRRRTFEKALTARQQLEQCASSCEVKVKGLHRFYWFPLHFSTTIVAATIVEIVNTAAGTTRTSTILNSNLPSGYKPPDTNEQGTQVATLTYSQQGSTKTTVLAFPTSFRSWEDGYTWQGVLQTEKDGKKACITAREPSFVPLPSFPQPSVTSTPTHSAGPDPKGLLFKFTKLDEAGQLYVSEFKDQAALQSCSMKPYPLPLAVEPTARFLSQTVTSFEGGQATSSSLPTNRSSPRPSTTTSTAAFTSNWSWILMLLCTTSSLVLFCF